MAKKRYDEVSVVRDLYHNNGVRVQGNLIQVQKGSPFVGIHTWGKIDYLCNYCGYRYTIGTNYDNYQFTNDDENVSNVKKFRKKRTNLNVGKINLEKKN